MATLPLPYPGAGGCNCCSLSRRCFLSASIAGFATPFVAAAAANVDAQPEDIGAPLDLKSLRPKPKVKIMEAVLRQPTPYWLGWPGTSYDLEGHRKEYQQAFQQMAARTGVTLEMEPAPLDSQDAINAWVEKVKAAKPEAILLNLQHLQMWKWLDPIKKAGIPTIIWSPIGMAFTQHVRQISRQPGIHVISSLDSAAMEQAFRMVRAKKQFEETRLLVLRGSDRKETVLDRLGTKVRYIPRDTLHELFNRMPLTEEAREIAKTAKAAAEKTVEPTEEDLHNAARAFLTARRLLRDEECNAITSDCLGMVSSRVVPTPPCMAVSMFQDHGVTYGCEADVFGALSLMLSSYLFDKPGFMNDPVPETVHNTLIAAHCVCGTRLEGFDGPQERHILRSHSESDLGVAVQVLWKEGARATLVRFQNPHELIVDTGTVVGNIDTPPAGGCRTSVEIQMDRMEDARDVMGFHQVVLLGDHRRDLQAFCQMNGIRMLSSPEVAPKAEPA